MVEAEVRAMRPRAKQGRWAASRSWKRQGRAFGPFADISLLFTRLPPTCLRVLTSLTELAWSRSPVTLTWATSPMACSHSTASCLSSLTLLMAVTLHPALGLPHYPASATSTQTVDFPPRPAASRTGYGGGLSKYVGVFPSFFSLRAACEAYGDSQARC